MIPTAALIDLNHLALKHLDKAFFYLQTQEYDLCTAELHAVNASLPPDYQITFDDVKYKELTEHHLEIFCKHCAESTFRDKIKLWNMLLPLDIQIIEKRKFVKAWTCEKCNDQNILSESRLVQAVHENPHFTKVVPMPPTRKQSASDRTAYHIKYKSWFGNVEGELTRQISQLRWDHWKRGDQDAIDVDEIKDAIQNLEDKY